MTRTEYVVRTHTAPGLPAGLALVLAGVIVTNLVVVAALPAQRRASERMRT